MKRSMPSPAQPFSGSFMRVFFLRGYFLRVLGFLIMPVTGVGLLSRGQLALASSELSSPTPVAASISATKEVAVPLIDHALHGFTGNTGVMPRKGERLDLSDEEIIAAVEYMVEQVAQ